MTRISLCEACLVHGFCQERTVDLVADEELSKPNFVRDLRLTAYDCGIQPSDWVDWISDSYRDWSGWVRDASGGPVFLDMSSIEDAPLSWFKEFCCTKPPLNSRLHIRKEARERVRVIGTVLRMKRPIAASLWGVIPANDR